MRARRRYRPGPPVAGRYTLALIFAAGTLLSLPLLPVGVGFLTFAATCLGCRALLLRWNPHLRRPHGWWPGR